MSNNIWNTFGWQPALVPVGAEDGEREINDVKGFCFSIKKNISPEMGRHIAIISALAIAFFVCAINGNFIFLMIVSAGALGEGYTVYEIYKQMQLEQNLEQPEALH